MSRSFSWGEGTDDGFFFSSFPDDVNLASALTRATTLDAPLGRSGLSASFFFKFGNLQVSDAWLAGGGYGVIQVQHQGRQTGGGVAHDGTGDEREIRSER